MTGFFSFTKAVTGHNEVSLEQNHCWGNEKVRKKGHYACVKDFLRAMDTDKAKSALPTVQERLKTMARKKNWPSNAHKTFPEFSSGGGGGSHGVGATKTAMRDIYVDRGGHLK